MKIRKSLFVVIVTAAISASLGAAINGSPSQNGVQQNGAVQSPDAQTPLRQAQELIRTRRFTEAAEVLRRVIQLQPNLAVAHLQLSIALMGVGQRDEAFTEAKRAVELDPNDAHAYVAVGNIDSTMRRYSEAIRAYKQAAALDPNYLSAYINLGIAYGTTLRFQESAEAFQQALRIDPKNVSALNGLGIAQFRLGQREEGIQTVREAVRLNPGFVDGHLNLARWFHGMGRYQEAADSFTQVTRLVPKWPQTYFERSQDNLYLGSYDAAASDARTYLELTDWHSDRAQYMVIIAVLSYRGAGKTPESKEVLDLAAKRSNSATWPYPIITYLRNEVGADALIAMAGTNNDRLTEAHGYIGMDLMLKDQRDEALSHFKWVRDRGNKTFVEYILAVIELNRLEGGNPRP